MGRGAWWATVHGVAQRRTRLKWLSTTQHETPSRMLTYTHTPASEGPRTPDRPITFLHPSPLVTVTSPFQPSVQGGPPSESTDLALAAVGGPSVTSPSVHTLCPKHLLMKRLWEKTRGESGPLWRGALGLLLLLQIQTGSPMRATLHHCLAEAAGPSLPSGDAPPQTLLPGVLIGRAVMRKPASHSRGYPQGSVTHIVF